MERLRKYKNGDQLDDFFSCLMTGKAGIPNNLEWGEIVSEFSVIINAGADTTAIALSNIIELLIRHPERLQRLRAEINEALSPEEFVAPYDSVKDLPFLKACIDECLRLIPPHLGGITSKDTSCRSSNSWRMDTRWHKRLHDYLLCPLRHNYIH